MIANSSINPPSCQHKTVSKAWNYISHIGNPNKNILPRERTKVSNEFDDKIFDFSRDSGVYRCVASRSYNGYSSYSGRRETVYMDVDFYPRNDDSYYGRGYDDYFNNRRYNYGYRRPYGYAYAKTSEDKALIETDAKKNKEDN